jgi:hypothetical protein
LTPWFQVAKQACLGTAYDVAGLPIVLTGHALHEAEQKVLEFREKGWSMQYKLSKCKVIGCSIQYEVLAVWSIYSVELGTTTKSVIGYFEGAW